MKVDATISSIISDVAERNNVKSEKILTILDIYYKTVRDQIEKDESNVIKIDFFGKLIHNQAWKDKVQLAKKAKQEKETTRTDETI
jgi:nucleoid DNA-binding protein